MNMKKTMAAIAAGAVAVSAMATTVSALERGPLETKTLTYNLVYSQKSDSSNVTLHATFNNIELNAGEWVQIELVSPSTSADNEFTVRGDYSSADVQAVQFTATNNKSSSKYNGNVAVSTNGKTITVPVLAVNTDPYAFVGGTAATVKSAGSGDITPVGTTLDATDANAQAKLNAATTAGAISWKYVADSNGDSTADDPGWNDLNNSNAIITAADFAAAGLAVPASPVAGTTTVTAAQYTAPTYNDDAVVRRANIFVDIDVKDLPSNYGELKDVNNQLGSGRAINVKFKVATSQANATAGTWDREINASLTADNFVAGGFTRFPYKSTINNNIGQSWSTATKTNHSGDVFSHIFMTNDWDLSYSTTPDYIKPYDKNAILAVVNDAVANFGSVDFVFNTAAHKVHSTDGSYIMDDSYASDEVDCRSFGLHLYNDNAGAYGGSAYAPGYDPNTMYIYNDWLGNNLFNGAVVINSDLTLSLYDTAKFDWTATSLTFSWDAIQDEALTKNAYVNYIQNMVLRTSTTWYWDNLQVVLGETDGEEVESGAPVEGDVKDLDEEEEETDLGDVEPEEEEEEEETEPVQEVAPVVENNPSTGNAPVALAVIPVALAAAAIVAKKRG
ncbi:MAG: hypothetical protein K2K44_10705 [Oscillospiraceae bacterium]|nr:hypothetical protein [Oscillospiraceae bacterium]